VYGTCVYKVYDLKKSQLHGANILMQHFKPLGPKAILEPSSTLAVTNVGELKTSCFLVLFQVELKRFW
jgi:hypothetical protein